MDANERLHRDWLGMAQPEGLVVTLSALKEAEANISWPVTDLQASLRELTYQGRVYELRALLRDLLGWDDDFLVERSSLPPHLSITVEEGDPLAPSYALRSADDPDSFVFVVTETRDGAGLDDAYAAERWTASAHQRFERLLRETGLGVGLLTNGRDFRLVYAPKGESAGWITFRLSEMLSVDGRPLLGAFHMLLNQRRLLTLPEERRLLGLLQKSRAYQSAVSTALREQVLGALRTLLSGMQAADALAQGALLRPYRGHAMHEVYLGLVTVLMRMVFVLFAEERDLLPMSHDLYAESYSLTKLYAQLVKDRGEHGEGLDQRYGAWARVLTLFRMLHDGLTTADGLRLPAREGKLFNPDEFPFLEGRPRGLARQRGERLTVPRVSDGVVFRVLDQLLVLGGERLQYKGLDVEQIGSVYEGLMGFEIEVAAGDSLCLTPDHVVVDLDALLAQPGAERLKQLKSLANLDVKDKAAGEVKAATTVAALHAALARRISPRQPGLLPRGTLFLQPGEERRRSGSHYTPRSLTQPIVETTLRPVLERLSAETAEREGKPAPAPAGEPARTVYLLTPEQILDLKICDPAMGSGAFLVETCRQLADHLVAAWRRTGTTPELPPDEDPLLHARRLVAQKCIYGVDKNPLAVDLARLSMWLVTFAKEHPFTFVDHSLRCGDSLVSLSGEQIFNLSLDPAKGHRLGQFRNILYNEVRKAEQYRHEIHAIGDPPDNTELRRLWREANEALLRVRCLGDLVVANYFAHDNDKSRKKAFEDLVPVVHSWLGSGGAPNAICQGLIDDLHQGERPLLPFHWEIEFPEVFGRENPGFDCFVGNPPFMGGTTMKVPLGLRYHEYIVDEFAPCTGNVDLVVFFLRMAFASLRRGGTFGLVATNSVAQGDNRLSGLEVIVQQGGWIFDARRRYKWPGAAAVVVSVVHVIRGQEPRLVRLDDVRVAQISPFLFAGRISGAPSSIAGNDRRSYVGGEIRGAGFVFEESPSGGSSSLADMHRILEEAPTSAQVIFPYMGGEDFAGSPRQEPSRFVIDFGERRQEEAIRWARLFSLVEERVKPIRAVNKQRNYREDWWLHSTRVPAATAYLRDHGRILALPQESRHLSVGFVGSGTVFAKKLILLLVHKASHFAVIQSRIHEIWARTFGSSLKDDLRYTPTSCFETYPFPPCLYSLDSPPPSPQLDALEAIGNRYYEFRAAMMADEAVRAKLMDGTPPEGLTKTYNKFHDPDCHLAGIEKLRELHAKMDRAVLDAYGWTDIKPEYNFREQIDESIRLTWAEETRDEVLARLLELNRAMAEQEAAEAKKAEAPKKGKTARKAEATAGEGEAPKKGRGGRKKKDEATLSLPGSDDEKVK